MEKPYFEEMLEYTSCWIPIIPYRHEVENPVEALRNYRKKMSKKIEEQEKLIFEELGGKIALKKFLPKDYYVEHKDDLIDLAYRKTKNNKKYDELELDMIKGALATTAAAGVLGAGALIADKIQIKEILLCCFGSLLLGAACLALGSVPEGKYGKLKDKLKSNTFFRIVEQNESYKKMKECFDDFVAYAWERGYNEKEIIASLTNEEFTEEVQEKVRNQFIEIYNTEVEWGIARLDANIPERYRTMRNNINTEIANKKSSISQDEQTN